LLLTGIINSNGDLIMRITPKSLIQDVDPAKILYIPKAGKGNQLLVSHSYLVAAGAIPLRGKFSLLPGMLSTLSNIRDMGVKASKVAIIIDDDQLSHKDLAELKDLMIGRQFCSMPIDNGVMLIVHTRMKPSELGLIRDLLQYPPLVEESRTLAQA
jgi:hypothetical protein